MDDGGHWGRHVASLRRGRTLELYRAARFAEGMSADRALTFVANVIGRSREETGQIIGQQLGQRDRVRS